MTTNSGSLLRHLLEHSDLWNLSSESLDGTYSGTEGILLEGKENEVVFGCVSRNEEQLGELEKEFIAYVKEKLEDSKKE